MDFLFYPLTPDWTTANSTEMVILFLEFMFLNIYIPLEH